MDMVFQIPEFIYLSRPSNITTHLLPHLPFFSSSSPQSNMQKVTRWVSVTAVAAFMVILQANVLLFPPVAAATETDDPCNGAECGMGNCRVSTNRAFGYVCECEPGWGQFRVNRADDPFRFLPCIIPNCTLNYACYNESMPEPPPSIPTPHNLSLFDPCFWSYCGSGKCVKTSGFRHQCECKQGFSNILNITSLPCVKACAVAADCTDLGFPLSNGSFPPSPTNLIRSSGQASSSQNSLLRLLLCATLAMVQAAWMKF